MCDQIFSETSGSALARLISVNVGAIFCDAVQTATWVRPDKIHYIF